ncbi:MAG TPA: glutamate-1-semialdehyde 2,1-aminomutase [Dehalococcoidia bacterium]
MTRSTQRSHQVFKRARRLFPGGVNSPVRAFRAVGGEPPVMAAGEGARLVDLDGNRYIDYVAAYGPLILGHAPEAVVEAVRRSAERGTAFGAPTEEEVELGELIRASVPSIEMLRFVNSGTEATMSALRLARAYTGREKIVKFEGCYHGHYDGLLAKAGSGVATLGLPGSAGVPAAVVRDTVVLPYNDTAAVEEAFREFGAEIAAVIVEPVAGNMGVVPPAPGFLEALRAVTEAHGALLIFDEVITGFRLGLGGAQGRYGVLPDLTCLGKIIGAGLPVGAYGGRREIMEQVAPEGPVYQAGTLSGNPLVMAAGLAVLRTLSEPGVYDLLDERAARLAGALARAAEHAEVPATINRVGSMLTVFFTEGPVTDYATAARSDTERYARFHRAMLERGVYLPPSQFEALFLSLAHSEEDLEETTQAAAEAMREAV